MSFALVSKDNKSFPITKEMALLSNLVGHMVDSGMAKEAEVMSIPIDKYKGKDVKQLAKWMSLYCEQQNAPSTSFSASSSNQPAPSTSRMVNANRGPQPPQKPQKLPIPAWERKFLKSLDYKSLISLTNLANYMQVSALIESSTTFIAEKLSSKTVDAAREYLGLVNDFTREEEMELLDRLGWADKHRTFDL